MATRLLEEETTLTPVVSVSNLFVERESEIHSYFDLMEKLLQDRRIVIINKLKEKRIEFEEMEKARLAQIKEIETIKLQMMGLAVKFNEVNILRERTARIYDDAMEKLKIPFQTINIIFEKFSDKMKKLIESIDLIILDEDYTSILEPILSINKDDILKSIEGMNSKDLAEHKEIDPEPENVGELVPHEDNVKQILKLKLSKIAIDSKTGRVFVINRESNNILVFQQDGSIITCFGENFTGSIEICIDSENDFIFVLEGDNILIKFNLINYELLLRKRLQESKLSCIDHHNGEVYISSNGDGIYVYNSELEYIKSISINTFENFNILCRDEGILIYSGIPAGLYLFSYSGDLVKNIPLSFEFGMKDALNLDENNAIYLPFQFYIDKNGLLVICNIFEQCIHIQTLDGTLVHKLVFPPEEEEDEKILTAGVTSSKDGRMIVSLANSKYPLRYY